MERKIVTHSMISCFMECRKKFEYRYIRGIAPVEKKAALSFGSAAHEVLEHYFYALSDADWATEEFMNDIRVEIELARTGNELSIEDGLKLEALMLKYAETYMIDDVKTLDVVATEREFRTPLRSTAGRRSRMFDLAGKADGLVRNKADGRLYILEHKTASSVDDGYLGRIEIDWQVALYARALSYELGEPVVGVVYDILVKPLIRMRQGEDDAEFEARRAASKTGNIKRKVAETNEEFIERLNETIGDANFIRQVVMFDEVLTNEFEHEIFEVSKDIGNCKCFYKNTGSCNKFGVCPYMDLCRNRGCLNGLEDKYEMRVPHEELSETITH